MLSERRRAIRGVLGVPWLEDAHLVAVHSVADENSLPSMRGVGVVREDPHVATDASHSVKYSIARQRNTRCRLPKCWLNSGFRAGHATHVPNMSEKWEAFVPCGCAELNDPPQRCLIGLQVDRSILR
ncbi:hypothetical protein TcCL_Unassigned01049 [Trypanosoma cruzi]|nr:hypothetical protein TcCL_Unassigned01049 [Trypanosoma cruzi]